MSFLDRFRGVKVERTPDSTKTLPEMMVSRLARQMPVWSDWNEATARDEGFNGNTWVFACISKRTRAIKSVPLQAGRLDADGEFQHDAESPLQQLLDSPNIDHDLPSLIERIVQQLDIGGNSYVHKVRAGRDNLPVELWPLQPELVGAVRGTERLVSQYQIFRRERQRNGRPVDPADMIHFRYENPADPLFGLSPLRPAGRTIDTDNEATAWQKVSFENRGISDVHFKFPTGVTQDQIDAARKKYQERQAGTKNARAALFSTADAQVLDKTPTELDFVNSRNALRVEICSALDVPPPLVGIYDDATLANIKTARTIFWLDGLLPLLSMILAKLNHSLAREFGPEWVIRADLSNVEALQEDRTAKIGDLEKLWRIGVPLNQAVQFLEIPLDDVPGGDIGYLPAGVLPAIFDDDENGEIETDSGQDEPIGTPGTDVESTALNGAQIGAIRDIVMAVAEGQLPAETAVQIILVGFPGIDEEQARRIIDPTDDFTPENVGDG